MTEIYFVRHAHSDYSPDEYNRPLSARGLQDVERSKRFIALLIGTAIFFTASTFVSESTSF